MSNEPMAVGSVFGGKGNYCDYGVEETEKERGQTREQIVKECIKDIREGLAP